MRIFLLNLLIWLIFPLPASIWWFNIMKSNYRSAMSWADKTAVGIICMIFVITVAINIMILCVICAGDNIFGV